MERGIYTYSELRQVFERLVRQYKPFKILFEETAVGQALKESKDLYSHYLIELKPVHPDPVGRFYTQQDKFSEGRVQFPHARRSCQRSKESFSAIHMASPPIS